MKGLLNMKKKPSVKWYVLLLKENQLQLKALIVIVELKYISTASHYL